VPRHAVILTNLLASLIALAGCESVADEPLQAQIDAVFQEAHVDGEFNADVLGLRTKVLRLLKRDARN